MSDQPTPEHAAGPSWKAWLTGGLGAGVVAAAIIAFVLASTLAGLLILVAGAVLTTALGLVLWLLR